MYDRLDAGDGITSRAPAAPIRYCARAGTIAPARLFISQLVT